LSKGGKPPGRFLGKKRGGYHLTQGGWFFMKEYIAAPHRGGIYLSGLNLEGVRGKSIYADI